MADINLSVATVGAPQAAAALDNVAKSVNNTSKSWDSLKQKLGSGEVLRNAAGTAALLATNAGSTTEKVAALGGALASIPGPIGAVAAGVAVAATVLGVYRKSAEEAAKATAELAKKLADLGKQKLAAESALAGAVGGAALRVGQDARAFNSSGASQRNLDAFQVLTPGDPNAALRNATQVARSGLSDAGQADVVKIAERAHNIGETIGQAFIETAIATVKENTANFAPVSGDVLAQTAAARLRTIVAGGGVTGGASRVGSETTRTDTGDLLDTLGGGHEQRLDEVNRAESQAGRSNERLLRLAEAPAVASSQAAIRDAFSAGVPNAAAALASQTQINTGATKVLSDAVTELSKQIDKATTAAPTPRTDSGWSTGVLTPGAGLSP